MTSDSCSKRDRERGLCQGLVILRTSTCGGDVKTRIPCSRQELHDCGVRDLMLMKIKLSHTSNFAEFVGELGDLADFLRLF